MVAVLEAEHQDSGLRELEADTADPGTLLFTGAFAEEPLAAATSLFLDNEFGRADVHKFAELATSPNHVASLDAATQSDRPASRRSAPS
jgi:hypothetical protein